MFFGVLPIIFSFYIPLVGHLIYFYEFNNTSLVAQTVKLLPTMWEIQVQSLGREDLLEKEMATHSSILAWKIPWMEKPCGLQSMGSQRVGHDRATSLSLFTLPIILKLVTSPASLYPDLETETFCPRYTLWISLTRNPSEL